MSEGLPIIYAVSDSIGETAETMARAAVSQFDASKFNIIRISYLETTEQIDRLAEQAGKQQCMICYTIVAEGLRAALEKKISDCDIASIDLLSPMIRGVAAMSGLKPLNKAGLIHILDNEYFKRVEAVEFAVKYDDGKNPWGLLQADVVLLGVSRTSKTPLSMYLAHKKIKVANVPLAPELSLPEELFRVPPHKIIGLIINPGKLNEIRAERLKSMGLSGGASYADVERINKELEYAGEIMGKLRCVVIDVSNKAIEETANSILGYVKKSGERVKTTGL